MKILCTIIAAAGLCLLHQQVSAQFILNKVRQKIEDKVVDKAFGGNSKSSVPDPDSPDTGNGKARNNGGEGLVSTPPDVKQNLADAEVSFKSGKYGEARYAVQQAMLGVEMEIGQKILKSLPETISGLKKDADADQVTSTGWGWAGLTIQRQYADENEKELRVIVANNSVWMSAVNLYLANGGSTQTSGGQQNWKQIKVKGHRAVIEYDEDSGYKLSVPFGQSSLLVYEGVNFKNEQEMLAAANAVDIDSIKKMLNEQ